MSNTRVSTSPLTNTIYAGKVLKDGTWATNKQDVTMDALVAVAQHVIRNNEPVTINANGEPAYRITVEELSE